ncbi:MAG: hypothetical protein NTX64_15630, partial [Elusimicrobia bacterium]|nr:hypothetical protein [Elusimicrobiota bacterium]
MTSKLLSGKRYEITARAKDNAGNIQTDFQDTISSAIIGFDINPPSIGFAQPAQGHAYQSNSVNPSNALQGPSAIAGTASDAEAALYPGGDALQPPEVVLWYDEVGAGGTTQYYYTQSNDATNHNTRFSSTTVESAQWHSDEGGSGSTNPWSYFMNDNSMTDTYWVSDRQYHAKVRTRDKARDYTGAIVG